MSIIDEFQQDTKFVQKIQAFKSLQHQIHDFKNSNLSEIDFEVDKNMSEEVLGKILIFVSDYKEKRKEAINQIETAIYKDFDQKEWLTGAPTQEFLTSKGDIFYKILDAELNNFKILA